MTNTKVLSSYCDQSQKFERIVFSLRSNQIFEVTFYQYSETKETQLLQIFSNNLNINQRLYSIKGITDVSKRVYSELLL